MSKKNLIFPLLIIFFIFFIPQISYENNISEFFLLLGLPLFVIVAFMGVWIIEALVINKRLTGTPQTAFFTSLIANLITGLLGFFIFFLDKILLKEYIIFRNFEVALIFFFLASVIIEAFVLYFRYRQENRTKIFTTSFLMNIIPYLFLIVFFIGDIGVICGLIIFAMVIPFFFLESFQLLSVGKKISKSTRIKIIVLILILILVVYGFIFIGLLEKRPHQASDSRIVSAIIQAKTVMVYVYGSDNNYDNFNCSNPNMSGLCREVVTGQLKKGINPIIAISPASNSTSVCIYSLLSGKGNQSYWYCADSTGYAGFCDGPENDPATTCRIDGTSAYCPPGCD